MLVVVFFVALMFIEYLFLVKYIFFTLIVAVILVGISFFFVYQQPETEKLSAYECGFNPFGDARSKFDVRFYLVGILFIIFDLEIAYLFP
jgi:NADH-quinone oxidoreductase subunit A